MENILNKKSKKIIGVLTKDIEIGENVEFPHAISVKFPDYSNLDFSNQVDIFINGRLMCNGVDNDGDLHDVYPGKNPRNGDIKFLHKLKKGTVVVVRVYE